MGFLPVFFAAIVASTSTIASSGPAPWYERASCHAVVMASFAADFVAAERLMTPLEASRDLDDQACAIWARASLAEFRIAVLGKQSIDVEGRKKAISRMFGFGKANASRGARFRDLELEARMRRVRVLAEEGQRSQALREGRQLDDMIRKWPRETPTFEYVDGATNGAIASTGWAARAVITIVTGVGSDAELSAKKLNELCDGKSIYKWDALYVAHHFSEATQHPSFRKPSEYSRTLVDRFPMNPQLAYDLARDLYLEKSPRASYEAAKPMIEKLDATPTLWSPLVRRKLYWIAGRAALDAMRDKAEAHRRATLALAERADVLEDELDDLIDESGS